MFEQHGFREFWLISLWAGHYGCIMGGMQFIAAKLNGLKNHVNTAKRGEDG